MNSKFAICTLVLAMLSACGGGGDSSSPGEIVTPPVANAVPLAQAGAVQNIVAGSIVTLDGSASSDANGDALTYNWVLTTKPAGSAAVLSSVTSAKPTFTADIAGAYVATLLVNDGKINSAASTVTVTASVANAAPVANAGAAQSVIAGSGVTLDGSASSDANGDSLTYAWVLTSKPSSSVASLVAPTSAKPGFIADTAGTYVATLVVSDGKLGSTSSTVTITAAVANVAPVAKAGSAQNIIAGMTVTLDGSTSSDANGDALSYTWVITSRPARSGAVLTSATSVKPTFTADVAGTYVATLRVNDGEFTSAASTVTVTASAINAAPVANAGPSQNVLAGASAVSLDGTASSDADGDVLTYKWTFVSVPANSMLQPFYTGGQTAAVATVFANVPGTYVVNLVVNDGKVDSAPSTMTITATSGISNAVPVANTGAAQYVVPGSTVNLNGSASSDANGDALTYKWTLTARPAGSSAALSSFTSATPTFVADVVGTYVAGLIVNDGKANSSQASVSVTATPNTLMLFNQQTSLGVVTESKVNLPYSNNANLQISCAGSCAGNFQLDSFKLTAVGSSFTIGNLIAKDSTGTVVPSFGGLTQGQIISAGNSVTFTLLTPKTAGANTKLVYQFIVAETGQAFIYNVDFKSN